MSDKLKIEIEAPIATICINRPDKSNALDRELWDALGQCFLKLDRNKQVRVYIISGLASTSVPVSIFKYLWKWLPRLRKLKVNAGNGISCARLFLI